MLENVCGYLEGNELTVDGPVEQEHYQKAVDEFGATEVEAKHFVNSDSYEEFRQNRFTLNEDSSLEAAYEQFKEQNDAQFLTGEQKERVIDSIRKS